MVKEWKSKRQLSLLVALALSVGGGQLYHHSAYAADVSGQNVTINSSFPPSPIFAGGITSTTNHGNVFNNTLTIDGVGLPSSSQVYAGYNLSATGNAEHNTLILKNVGPSSAYAYAGYSANGNATNNTVILHASSGLGGVPLHADTWLYGGESGNPSADVTTGNTLRVEKAGNIVSQINNFEKMVFDLGTGVNSGDTMLTVGSSNRPFDWNNISVENGVSWFSGATTSKSITLLESTLAYITLQNYNVTGTRLGDFEYGLRSDASGSGTVGASKIFFDANKYQNATVTYSTTNPFPSGSIFYSGISRLGSRVNNNTLTVDGVGLPSSSQVYAGYNSSATGNAEHNTLILKNVGPSSAYAYAGYSANGNATNNTVILHASSGLGGVPLHADTWLYGGESGNPSADVTTGNTLRVEKAGNIVSQINNFEKMVFDLGTGVNSGDTMLTVGSSNRPFDWNNISVVGLNNWIASTGVNNPTAILYSGTIDLTNYAPTLVGTVGDYEFGKKSDAATTGTVTAYSVSLDGNRFQNATETPTTWASDVHAGLSIYGNTTNHNTLNINMGLDNARAGYTNAQNGGQSPTH